MILYVRELVFKDDILHENLKLLKKGGFVKIASQNDNTFPEINKFIKEENLKFIGIDGAGNQAEAFYIKE